MKRGFSTYLTCALIIVGFMACGGDSDDDVDKLPTQPSTSGGGDALQIDVDYPAEEAAIIEAFTLHAEAIGTEDANQFMAYWLRSESENVFVAWVFWAGAFEKHLGWQAVRKAWEGIFHIRSGNMSVDINSVAINTTGKKASLHGSYRWAVNGNVIALLVKDRDDGWQIQQADYTGGGFGKQVEVIENPAYVNPPPEDE